MKTVIDSGIFMNISYLPSIEGDIYIPSSILEEVKSYTAKNVMDLALANRKVLSLQPEEKYIKIINELARSMGQTRLSKQDIEVLALALSLSEHDEVMILTDDYGLKNIAHELKMKTKGMRTSKGNQKRIYAFICLACDSKFNFSIDECEICGHNKFKRVWR
jgi:rRNA maturation endonuclease Nob1